MNLANTICRGNQPLKSWFVTWLDKEFNPNHSFMHMETKFVEIA